MKLDKSGSDFIKKNEGFRLTSYKDSVGVWTIGYGNTGKHIHKGMKISKEEAGRLFAHDVEWAERAVNKYVTATMTQGQFNALVDFAFNLGANALHGSTLLGYLNAGKISKAANEFHRWNHAGHRELKGLTRRRAEEKERFLS